jgi:hypothetical protein
MNALTEDREALFARARSADWCASRGIVLRGSITVASEAAWRNALEMATEPEYEMLMANVKATEVVQAQRRAWGEDFDRALAERDRPNTEAEDAEFNRIRLQAIADAQAANTVESRLGRIESVLLDIRDGLKTR